MKADNEKLKNELNALKKSSKEQHDRLVKENAKNNSIQESDKHEEIKRMETQLKQQIEKLKLKLSEKEQEIKEIEQENNLLKSQIEILDNNMNSSKQAWSESK